MDLFSLFAGLPRYLQNKIKIYYLSYGTNECRIVKKILNNDKYMKNNLDTTLWYLFIRKHGYLKCRIRDDVKIPSVYYELQLILYDKPNTLEDSIKDYFRQYISEKMQCRFIQKYESLL